MKCPNDKSNLVLKTQEGVFANCCEECDGIFLKTRGVDAFKYKFVTDCVENAFKNDNFELAKHTCSNCRNLMHKVEIDLMAIQICKNCRSAFFQKEQISQLKNKHVDMSDTEVALLGCLPSSLVAIFALYKYFTINPDSKNRRIYLFLFFMGLFFSVLFWKEFSSI